MKAIIGVCVFLVALQVDAYRILGVFPTPSFSHFVLGSRLMKALAENGHDVTMISPYKEKKSLKNYREIVLEEVFKKSEGKVIKKKLIQKSNIVATILSKKSLKKSEFA